MSDTDKSQNMHVPDHEEVPDLASELPSNAAEVMRTDTGPFSAVEEREALPGAW